MPKYKIETCSICGSKIKGRRNYIKHLVSNHTENIPSIMYALAYYFKDTERIINDHFYCSCCGKLISDDKVWKSVIDKGKSFIPKYCSLKCQKIATIRLNHKDGYTHRGETLYSEHSKLISEINEVSEASNYRLAELCKEDLNRDYNKVVKCGLATKTVHDKTRESFFNNNGYYWSSPMSARVYVTLVNHPDFGIICKIGTGNPWRRWKCIELHEKLIVLRLYESVVINSPSHVEGILHKKFKDFNLTCIVPKNSEFSENSGKPFWNSNGYTEWFDGECFEDAVEELRKLVPEVIDTTEGYNEYWSNNSMVKINTTLSDKSDNLSVGREGELE